MNFHFLLSYFCCSILVGASYAAFQEKMLEPGDNSSLSVRATSVEGEKKFEFNQDFVDLVQEAINSELPKLFAIPSQQRRKLSAVEGFICDMFEGFRNIPRRWQFTLRSACNVRLIFGKKFTKPYEAVTVGIMRILKAEGSDFSKLFPGVNPDWAVNSENICLLYSKILGKAVSMDFDDAIASLTWLFVGYRDKFGAGILKEENPKRVTFEATNEASNTSNTNVIEKTGNPNQPLPIASETKTISAIPVPQPISVQPAVGSHPQAPTVVNHPQVTAVQTIVFRTEFQELVRTAIKRQLHKDFSLAPDFPRKLSDMEEKIYQEFKGKKHWATILTKVCTKNSIVEKNMKKADEVIIAVLRRIFKAENIDFDTCFNRMFTYYWMRTSTNVDFLYSQILGEDVSVERENIAPSLTYLFLSYYKKYLKKGVSEAEKSISEEIRNSEVDTITNNNRLKRKAPSNEGVEKKRQKVLGEDIIVPPNTTTTLAEPSHIPAIAIPVHRPNSNCSNSQVVNDPPNNVSLAYPPTYHHTPTTNCNDNSSAALFAYSYGAGNGPQYSPIAPTTTNTAASASPPYHASYLKPQNGQLYPRASILGVPVQHAHGLPQNPQQQPQIRSPFGMLYPSTSSSSYNHYNFDQSQNQQ